MSVDGTPSVSACKHTLAVLKAAQAVDKEQREPPPVTIEEARITFGVRRLLRRRRGTSTLLTTSIPSENGFRRAVVVICGTPYHLEISDEEAPAVDALCEMVLRYDDENLTGRLTVVSHVALNDYQPPESLLPIGTRTTVSGLVGFCGRPIAGKVTKLVELYALRYEVALEGMSISEYGHTLTEKGKLLSLLSHQ